MKDSVILLGIDIGTTDTKCSFYTPNGRVISGTFSEYSMIHPKNGWVEEDPNLWWKAIKDNINNCVRNDGVDLCRVGAISVSCTNAFFPVDSECNPVHNAIMQIDQRAADEVDWIESNIGSARIYEITGNRIARGTFFMPTVLWFIHNRPEIVEKAYKFLTPSGFAVCKLTGEYTINKSRMGFSLMADIRKGIWSEELISLMGMDFNKLPRPCDADEIVGYVSKQAAEETGLPEGIPVVGGAMDTVAAAVGAGAIKDGDVFMALGTCGRICHSTSNDDFSINLMNCANAVHDQYLNVDATNACGVALRWFRDTFGAQISEIPEVKGMKTYDALDYLAENSEPGASGVIFLPYLSGERCPIWDPDAKGSFVGLSLSTKYGDVVRAVLEGVAFTLRQGLEYMNVRKDKPLALGGGIANSRIWCEIIANVTRHPIIRTDINETETLGDAILAGHAIGVIDDMSEIGKKLIENGEIINVNEEIMGIYDARYEVFKKTYSALKAVFPEIKM